MGAGVQAAAVVDSSRAAQQGGGSEGRLGGVQRRSQGVGALLSLSGGVVSAPVGALLGAAAAREVSGSIISRTGPAVEKAVCFITPRTQAAAAATAGSTAQGQHITAQLAAAAAQSAALQRLHEGAAQHSVTLPAAAAPRNSSVLLRSSSAGGGSVCSIDDGTRPGSSSEGQQQQPPGNNAPNEEQQRRLVHSTCKALGSGTAAEAYVASLPDDAMAADFSASGGLWGLWQLAVLGLGHHLILTTQETHTQTQL